GRKLNRLVLSASVDRQHARNDQAAAEQRTYSAQVSTHTITSRALAIRDESSRFAALLGRLKFFPLSDAALKIIFFKIVYRQPREAHLVDRSRAAAHPILRIRIPPVGRRVVVPRNHMDDRPRW